MGEYLITFLFKFTEKTYWRKSMSESKKIMMEIKRKRSESCNEVLELSETIDFDNPKLVGESKELYSVPNSELCIIKLKPTLYSYTYNRYGIVKGTDYLRLCIWDVLDLNINFLFSTVNEDD